MLWLLLMLVSGTIGATTGNLYKINTQNMQQIRQATYLVSHPVLREIVLEWMESIPRGQIEINHAQNEEGKMLALELRSGLVALGIPSNSINLRGSKSDMRYLELRVILAEKP